MTCTLNRHFSPNNSLTINSLLQNHTHLKGNKYNHFLQITNYQIMEELSGRRTLVELEQFCHDNCMPQSATEKSAIY